MIRLMYEHAITFEVLRRSRWFNPRARLHYAACVCGWYCIRWTRTEVELRADIHRTTVGASPYGPLRAVSDRRSGAVGDR